MSIRTICCVCHKTKNLDGWLDQFIHQYKSLSHGYCPECFEKTMKQLQRRNRENLAVSGKQPSKELGF